MKLSRIIYIIITKIKNLKYKFIDEKLLLLNCGKVGHGSHILRQSNIIGIENIYLGNNVIIGLGSTIYTTNANVIIKDKVIVGPHLTLITGDHQFDILGKEMIDITDNQKDINLDQDIVIEEDVWIGANVTILKGVTIGSGCVIAAGSLVTKNTKPYGIYAGVPTKLIKMRFTEEEIKLHLDILNKK